MAAMISAPLQVPAGGTQLGSGGAAHTRPYGTRTPASPTHHPHQTGTAPTGFAVP